MPRPEALIVCAVRTPVGKYGGNLSSLRPADLNAIVLRSLVDRAGIDPSLLAGFPYSVPGTTVNRLCGSSLDAINQAARGSGKYGLATMCIGVGRGIITIVERMT